MLERVVAQLDIDLRIAVRQAIRQRKRTAAIVALVLMSVAFWWRSPGGQSVHTGLFEVFISVLLGMSWLGIGKPVADLGFQLAHRFGLSTSQRLVLSIARSIVRPAPALLAILCVIALSTVNWGSHFVARAGLVSIILLVSISAFLAAEVGHRCLSIGSPATRVFGVSVGMTHAILVPGLLGEFSFFHVTFSFFSDPGWVSVATLIFETTIIMGGVVGLIRLESNANRRRERTRQRRSAAVSTAGTSRNQRIISLAVTELAMYSRLNRFWVSGFLGVGASAFMVIMYEMKNTMGLLEASVFSSILVFFWVYYSGNLFGIASPSVHRYLFWIDEFRLIFRVKTTLMVFIAAGWLAVQLALASFLDDDLTLHIWLRVFAMCITALCFMVASGAIASVWFPRQPRLSDFNDLYATRWAVAMTTAGGCGGLVAWLIVTAVIPGITGVVLCLVLGGAVVYFVPGMFARPRLWRKALLDV